MGDLALSLHFGRPIDGLDATHMSMLKYLPIYISISAKEVLTPFGVNTREHANGSKSKVAARTGQTGQARRSDRCPRVCLTRAFERVITTVT
jgi:hypothetical protein